MDLTRISDNCDTAEEFAEDLAKVLQLPDYSATCDDDTQVVPLLACKNRDDFNQVFEDMIHNGGQVVIVKQAQHSKMLKGTLCRPFVLVPADDGNLDLDHIEHPEFCLKVIDARDERFMISLVSERLNKDNFTVRDVYQSREIWSARRIKYSH